jgi:hypothetical protein
MFSARKPERPGTPLRLARRKIALEKQLVTSTDSDASRAAALKVRSGPACRKCAWLRIPQWHAEAASGMSPDVARLSSICLTAG